MQNNKLRMAIRATAAVTVLGLASQAQAFSFSAGDVDASLYGYARLNASYDIDDNIADSTQSGSFDIQEGDIPEGHFGMSANQSRLGLNLTNADGVKVNVEGDFAAGNFRLRHAYGEYKGVLAGQTWSNYNSFVGNTSILDFTAAAGAAGYQLRSAQVRYTNGPLSISAEDPKGSLYDAAADDQKDSMPALTARFENSMDGMSFSVAALVKQSSYDTGTNDDDAFGFAGFGALKVAVSDTISIQGAVNYSDGANSYVYLSGAPDAYLDNGDLETISSWGGTIGTGISLGNGRSINLAYGMTKVDWDDDAAFDGEAETNQNIFLNYQWTPVRNTMMGIEYQYWDTETKAGDSADANRLMFAAQYNF